MTLRFLHPPYFANDPMESYRDDKIDFHTVLPDREGLRDAGGAGLPVPGGQRTLSACLRGRSMTVDKHGYTCKPCHLSGKVVAQG